MTADCGWLWLFAGAALMLLELVTPGFVLFFFGLAAATVGGIRLAVGEAFTLAAQLAAFSALSVVYLVALRRFVTRLFADGAHAARPDIDNEYVGRVGRVTAAIAPARPGRVEIGDAEWTATADAPVAAGAAVKVVSQENLTMKVEEIA
ncbi:MAG: NfeD family protein [Kiritimatiellae bacterium]|nr:NfeD family protein [Kiritimatiellia bacterium]